MNVNDLSRNIIIDLFFKSFFNRNRKWKILFISIFKVIHLFIKLKLFNFIIIILIIQPINCTTISIIYHLDNEKLML